MALSPGGYIAVSLAVGLLFGVFLQKARFCFVSAFRDFVAFKDTRVLQGVLVGIGVMTLFWSLQATFGYFRGFWTPAWGLGSFLGGLVFGLGMTFAGGCASGTLYRARLPDEPSGGQGPVADTRAQASLGGRRVVTAFAVGVRGIVDGTVSYLRGFWTDDRPVRERLRDSWDARTAGIAMALVASVWFWVHGHWAITGSEARWAGYLLGEAGVDVANIEYWGSILFRDGNIGVTVDMLMIGSLIVGSFLAAYASGDFRIRKPKRERLPNYIVGGLLMGVGSRLAAGCNIANLFSGVALLSVHSFLAGAGIIAGVYIMTHYMYREVGCAL